MRINQNPGFSTPDHVAVRVHNADTVTIPVGAPMVLKMNGTNDGVDVVLPSTSGALNLIIGLLFGVCTKAIAVGGYGEGIVYGLTNSIQLIRQTRASSTNVWASEAARSVGEFLTVDTVNNGFLTTPSSYLAVTASTATAAATIPFNPIAVMGQTLASYASSASTSTDTRTAITAMVKSFVSLM